MMMGTPHFMAPEVFHGEKYNGQVDIYSLGIVLYRLLNHGRLPFVPRHPDVVGKEESARALTRRMSGERFLPPDQVEGELAGIVLRACAYRPTERYASPLAMKSDLEHALRELSFEEAEEELTRIASESAQPVSVVGAITDVTRGRRLTRRV